MIPVMVVPILANSDLLYRLVASIDHEVDKLVIIDNGAGVDNRILDDALEDSPVNETWTLPMPSNLGVASSWNLGIKCTPFASWWLICNFDVELPPNALAAFDYHMQSCTGVMLSAGAPPWCMFGITDNAVLQVGLFDERFHPGYYEDDDYAHRCHAAGVPIIPSGVFVHHANSSTLDSGYRDRNASTFTENQRLWLHKVDSGDLSEGGWSLRRRRDQSWD